MPAKIKINTRRVDTIPLQSFPGRGDDAFWVTDIVPERVRGEDVWVVRVK
jgi:hypothetical protein